MRRRLSLSICFVAAAAVLLTATLIFSVIYKWYYSDIKNTMRIKAEYIAAAMDLDPQGYLNAIGSFSNSRLTWIGADGDVLFDSWADAKEMENHADRPEFAAAVQDGYGQADRLSETLREQTYYCAVRLKDNTVIRIANTTDSIYSILLNNTLYFLLIILIVFTLAILLADIQTRRIIAPINAIDLDNPLSGAVYDELAPLAQRIEKQNGLIKKYIAKLQEKQLEFLTLTDNMSEGFLLLDKKSVILSYNFSALSILGIPNCDCRGKSVLILNRGKEFLQTIDSAQAGIGAQAELALSGRRYLLFANPVKAAEQVSGVVVIIIDITEKHLREALRREFSANVSHELKTPLTTISGYAEIIKNGLVKSEDIPRFTGYIHSESQRLIALIDDIIKLSWLDENGDDVPKARVDLLAIAKRVCESLADKAQKHHVTVSVSGEKTTVDGVAHILEEMVCNLCDNAVKYNVENGTVDVWVGHQNGSAVVRVADSGIGIPPQDKERIFERFYRADKSRSKETGGTGLGLSIVRHGALLHNARLEVESEVGKGTAIAVIFG